MDNPVSRLRWAAIGAAAAVAVGAGGLQVADATLDSGERPAFVPITPCRLVDTRPAPDTVGPRTSPLGVNDTHVVSVLGTNGDCTIPPDATGLMMTLVGLNQTATTFLTAWPSGQPQPTASSLNIAGNATGAVSGLASVDVGAGGQINIFNKNGSINLIADVVGYFVDHTHDDRYFTEAEVSAMISAHNHNDLYYTKAQVDTRVADADLEFFGAITAAGTFYSGSGNFTVSRPVTGEYCIVLPKTAHSFSAVVSMNNVESGGNASTGTLNGSACNPLVTPTTEVIPVYIADASGAPLNANFNFIAMAD